MCAYAHRHPRGRRARRALCDTAAAQACRARAFPRRPDRRPPDHPAERAAVRARIARMTRAHPQRSAR